MIKQLRVDERLIHGQIVTAWSRALDVDAIVVANDRVANNAMEVKMLSMAAPTGKKVTVRTVEGCIKLLSDPRAESMKILLIVDNPKDALTLAREKALKITSVNVGNYVKKASPDKVVLSGTIMADKEDLQDMKGLCELEGVDAFAQVIPTTEKVQLMDMIKKYL